MYSVMRSINLLFLFILACGASFGAACTNTTFSGFTAVQCKSAALATTTSQSVAMDSNITSGNEIVGFSVANNATTLSVSGTSCQSITFTTALANSNRVLIFSGKAASSGTCTVTVNSTNSVGVTTVMVEISGTNGTIDTSPAANSAFNGGGCNTTPCTITTPALTTAVNGDLIISAIGDQNSQGATVTANTGSILIAISNIGMQAQVQTTAGAITPSLKYNSGPAFTAGGGSVAIEAGGGGGGSTSNTPAIGRTF